MQALNVLGPTSAEDFIVRSKREAASRVDATDKYRTETVTVESGPRNTKVEVVLKIQIRSNYVFAVFAENPSFHARPAIEWNGAAKAAVEKFCAIRGLQTKLGPRPEDQMPLDWMAEVDRVIADE